MKRGQQSLRCLDDITDSRDVSLRELQVMVMDREAWHAVIHGVAKSRTWLSDWTELNWNDTITLNTHQRDSFLRVLLFIIKLCLLWLVLYLLHYIWYIAQIKVFTSYLTLLAKVSIYIGKIIEAKRSKIQADPTKLIETSPISLEAKEVIKPIVESFISQGYDSVAFIILVSC